LISQPIFVSKTKNGGKSPKLGVFPRLQSFRQAAMAVLIDLKLPYKVFVGL
jgi:hypothetical protein